MTILLNKAIKAMELYLNNSNISCRMLQTFKLLVNKKEYVQLYKKLLDFFTINYYCA